MTQLLSIRSPVRCWYRSPAGFSSRPWGLLDVITALDAGARFSSGYHDFDSREASFAAINGVEVLQLLVEPSL